MGRSVSIPHNAVASFTYWLDDEDDEDDDDFSDTFENIVQSVIDNVIARWPSFTEEKVWIDREDYVVASNTFVKIGVSEYCGLVSVWLISKQEEYEYYWSAEDMQLSRLCKGFVSSICAAFASKETFFK